MWRQELGYTDGNTLETLRSKYRALALQRHPNKRGGSTEAFQRLQRAWEMAQREHRLAATPRPVPARRAHSQAGGRSHWSAYPLTPEQERAVASQFSPQIKPMHPSYYWNWVAPSYQGKPMKEWETLSPEIHASYKRVAALHKEMYAQQLRAQQLEAQRRKGVFGFLRR